MPSTRAGFGNLDVTTRPKRRKAVSLIVSELSRIRNSEEAYMERIPENMQCGNAYAAADYSVDMLNEAIDTLEDVY